MEIAANGRIGGIVNKRNIADTKPISLTIMSNRGNAQIF